MNEYYKLKEENKNFAIKFRKENNEITVKPQPQMNHRRSMSMGNELFYNRNVNEYFRENYLKKNKKLKNLFDENVLLIDNNKTSNYYRNVYSTCKEKNEIKKFQDIKKMDLAYLNKLTDLVHEKLTFAGNDKTRNKDDTIDELNNENSLNILNQQEIIKNNSSYLKATFEKLHKTFVEKGKEIKLKNDQHISALNLKSFSKFKITSNPVRQGIIDFNIPKAKFESLNFPKKLKNVEDIFQISSIPKISSNETKIYPTKNSSQIQEINRNSSQNINSSDVDASINDNKKEFINANANKPFLVPLHKSSNSKSDFSSILQDNFQIKKPIEYMSKEIPIVKHNSTLKGKSITNKANRTKCDNCPSFDIAREEDDDNKKIIIGISRRARNLTSTQFIKHEELTNRVQSLNKIYEKLKNNEEYQLEDIFNSCSDKLKIIESKTGNTYLNDKDPYSTVKWIKELKNKVNYFDLHKKYEKSCEESGIIGDEVINNINNVK